ncbi:MAG: AAA family ATPase [Desulfobacterota bacterium]|nr:AAA family ATPase [Thermodesulfobacteriota bacterium]
MRFSEFVGHPDAKLSLILNAIDFRCGGVLFIGEKGSGKSTLARLFKELLPEDTPFVELPLNITEDRLMGGIDIEKTLSSGKRVLQKGLLCKAHGGVVYVDDINLLPPEILPLLMAAQDKGEVIIEREGFALKYPSRFVLIASMNPEEGNLSPHLLDRFGMCVIWQGLRDAKQRMEVIRKAGGIDLQPHLRQASPDHHLKHKIASARNALAQIAISDPLKEYIADLCRQNLLPGHRGDIYLTYAARAYAAYCGHPEVTQEGVDEVLPLVLTHRVRMLEQMKPVEEPPPAQKERPPEVHERQGSSEDPGRTPESTRSEQPESEGLQNTSVQGVELRPKEEVFEVGHAFKIRRMSFRKDRIYRMASGRRTKTRVKDKGGRYLKSLFRGKDDIAIDATIRASTPFQAMRGRKDRLVIHEEDLRFKQRERKMGHLVVFVLDGSGSMAARRRMVETKGAILSLLMDCYQKRDQVSLIVFRRDRAELVLPPTKSLNFSLKKLTELPVGGKTPLSAGLLEAYKLIRRMEIKAPETRTLLVLITDGRANQALTDLPVGDEIKKVAACLRGNPRTDIVVVDTEDKKGFMRTDLAQQLATYLEADYYTVEGLRSEFLTELIQAKKNARA